MHGHLNVKLRYIINNFHYIVSRDIVKSRRMAQKVRPGEGQGLLLSTYRHVSHNKFLKIPVIRAEISLKEQWNRPRFIKIVQNFKFFGHTLPSPNKKKYEIYPHPPPTPNYRILRGNLTWELKPTS